MTAEQGMGLLPACSVYFGFDLTIGHPSGWGRQR